MIFTAGQGVRLPGKVNGAPVETDHHNVSFNGSDSRFYITTIDFFLNTTRLKKNNT